MKVGINSLQVRAARSGVGQYIYCLLEELIPLTRDIEFINYVNKFNRHSYDFKSPNYHAKVWGSGSRIKSLRLLYEYAFFPFTLRKDNVTFLHAPSNLLPLRKPCPFLVTIHDMSYFVDPARYTPTKLFYWRHITRRTIHLADYIITDSEYSKNDILRFFAFPPEKIKVVYLAPHKMFRRVFDSDLKEQFLKRYNLRDRGFILNVGTLEPGKNQKRLVEAFDRVIKKSGEDLKLVIVGDKGWLYKDVLEIIEQKELRERVVVTGHVPAEDLLYFYNCAEMLVFPSLNEGFGMPVLEAMACGLPVITSHVSSLPETAGNAALFVDPLDVDSIAAAIMTLLGDGALREDLVQKGFEHKKRFSWQKTALQTLAVYRLLGLKSTHT